MTVVYDSGVTDVMTTTTSSKGTVRWMSPELVNPDTFGGQNGNPTKASDVYALAMVILEVSSEKLSSELFTSAHFRSSLGRSHSTNYKSTP